MNINLDMQNKIMQPRLEVPCTAYGRHGKDII